MACIFHQSPIDLRGSERGRGSAAPPRPWMETISERLIDGPRARM
uniref:Uncharacterized protein n=1 Tax=Setaria italica TaxID=4555 RepID=K3ZPR3_SETIT